MSAVHLVHRCRRGRDEQRGADEEGYAGGLRRLSWPAPMQRTPAPRAARSCRAGSSLRPLRPPRSRRAWRLFRLSRRGARSRCESLTLGRSSTTSSSALRGRGAPEPGSSRKSGEAGSAGGFSAAGGDDGAAGAAAGRSGISVRSTLATGTGPDGRAAGRDPSGATSRSSSSSRNRSVSPSRISCTRLRRWAMRRSALACSALSSARSSARPLDVAALHHRRGLQLLARRFEHRDEVADGPLQRRVRFRNARQRLEPALNVGDLPDIVSASAPRPFCGPKR